MSQQNNFPHGQTRTFSRASSNTWLQQDLSLASNPTRKPLRVLCWTICLLLALETVLQVRSHYRYGQSVLNAFSQETLYVTDALTGLKILRPNHVFHGTEVDIRTNGLGLRSPSISSAKPADTLRVAVIGASTAQGAYARTNEDTFVYRLGKLLERSHPATHIEVINAGIAGYGLTEQRRMLEKIVLPLQPDIVIAYSGFNDFAEYCRDQTGETDGLPRARRVGLPLIEPPSWLLAIDVIRKNTVSLRSSATDKKPYRSAEALDLTPYKRKLDDFFEVAKRGNVKLVFATNARAFRRDQPEAEQLALSETARYYNPCFDLAGLHTLHDRHNAAILEATRRHGAHSVPLHDLIPGGRRYFVDANHFSDEGEKSAAEHLHRFLNRSSLLRDN